jgi:hypothetical protein
MPQLMEMPRAGEGKKPEEQLDLDFREKGEKFKKLTEIYEKIKKGEFLEEEERLLIADKIRRKLREGKEKLNPEEEKFREEQNEGNRLSDNPQ